MTYKKIIKPFLFIILGWLSIFTVNVSIAFQFEIFTVTLSFVLFLLLGNFIPSRFRIQFLAGFLFHIPILFLLKDFNKLPFVFNYFLVTAFCAFFSGVFLNKIKILYNLFISILLLSSFYFISNKYMMSSHTVSKSINKQLPAFDLISKNDTLNTKYFDDKIVVIELWSKNCGYCKVEFSYMEELNNYYKNRTDIIFLLVNPTLDTYEIYQESVSTFSNDLTVPFYYDSDTILSNFLNINGVPYTIVFDKNMKVHKIIVGFGKTVESQFIDNIKETIAEIDNPE